MAEGDVLHYTEWTPRPIRSTRYAYEDISRETSNIMNLIGYGPLIRKTRIDAYKKMFMDFNTMTNDVLVYAIAGSKAEGLTCILESDTDNLIIPSTIMCMEEGIDQSTIPGHIIVFSMNVQRTSAGYCRLLSGRHRPVSLECIHNSLCDDGRGNCLLSCALFLEQFEKDPNLRVRGTVSHARAGPSLPWTYGPMSVDNTQAIRCHCPSILQTWANRSRHWPPPGVVEKVVAMGAFVTPIGNKRSAYNHVEWRICFNIGETELVNNLNDTQVKLYVLLKMIVKNILKPKTKEITSYILKNIVLWLAENNPQTLFHSGSLFHWLHEALDILRTAISTKQLPYYMIPERNLMTERDVEDTMQRVLVSSITRIMNEGPRVLLRLEEIRRAIISHPEPLLWYSKIRTELEILSLMHAPRAVKYISNYFQGDLLDTLGHAIDQRINDIMHPVLLRMNLEGSVVNDRVQVSYMMLR